MAIVFYSSFNKTIQKMARKRIGIPGYKVGDAFGVGLNNMDYISTFGDPVIIMPTDDFRDDIDLLYLSGGADLNPQNYDEVPSFKTTNSDVFKQYFYEKKLDAYIGKVPIFGVCLGFQMLNVFFGGKLQQHTVYHPTSKDRWKEGHEVSSASGTFKVNSHHHQLIPEKLLAPSLRAIAWYDCQGDGRVIEALKHVDLPIAGVQWHPEEWRDTFSNGLITKLLSIKLK